jgi:hypothetical protein
VAAVARPVQLDAEFGAPRQTGRKRDQPTIVAEYPNPGAQLPRVPDAVVVVDGRECAQPRASAHPPAGERGVDDADPSVGPGEIAQEVPGQ